MKPKFKLYDDVYFFNKDNKARHCKIVGIFYDTLRVEYCVAGLGVYNETYSEKYLIDNSFSKEQITKWKFWEREINRMENKINEYHHNMYILEPINKNNENEDK